MNAPPCPAVAIVVVTLCAVVAAACSSSPVPEDGAENPPDAAPVTEVRVAMGSELRLTTWASDETRARAAFEEVFAEFDRLESLMSVWREDSDVLRVNAAAGGDAVTVSPEVIEVLQLARQISEWTNGKFDITFGALSDLWRFDHDQDNVIPDPADIAGRLPLVAWELIEVNEGARTVRLLRAGMRMHLGGIGKGFAVDRGAEILRAHGLNNFLIQAGGDLYVGGTPEGRPWRLGIQDPRGAGDSPFAVVNLTDETLSTSGDYERAFIQNGRRYHHILDPDIGVPAMASRSVTIVTRQAVLADALSTGVFILGPEAGLALIESLADVEGVIVSADNEVFVSSGLQDEVTLLSPPGDGL